MDAVDFLTQIVCDPALQDEIRAAGVTFEAAQAAAERRGYQITVADLDAALANNPELLVQVGALLESAEVDFELNETELALIAGGLPTCCVNCDQNGPGYNPIGFKYV